MIRFNFYNFKNAATTTVCQLILQWMEPPCDEGILPILADALQDAGFKNSIVLSALRKMKPSPLMTCDLENIVLNCEELYSVRWFEAFELNELCRSMVDNVLVCLGHRVLIADCRSTFLTIIEGACTPHVFRSENLWGALDHASYYGGEIYEAYDDEVIRSTLNDLWSPDDADTR